MPGSVRHFRKNQGIHVEGRGKSIDIIVRGIGGSQAFREVDFEVLGKPEPETFHRKHFDASLEVIDDVWVQIAKVGARERSNRVALSYFYGDGYISNRRDYEPVE